MKIQHLSILTVLILLFSGCQSYTAVTTEIVEDSETFGLCEGCPSTFEFTASLEFPTAGANSEALPKIQEKLTAMLFGQEYAPKDIRAIMTKYKQSALQNYRDSNIEEWKQFGQEEDMGSAFNWVEGINAKFLGQYKDMQSYTIYRYGFTGGAHGIDSEEAVVFDLKTGDIVTGDDLFKEGWETPMADLLTMHLKDAYEDPEAYEMLFVKEIAPNNNFYITDKGITYIYGRYEIGPYVVGITNVTVPWEELKELMK